MIFDNGYNINGQLPPLFEEKTDYFQNKFTQGIQPSTLLSGDLDTILTLSGGSITSTDYEVGVSGWKLNADGTSDIN